jgi:hypothetical protein
MSYDVHFFSIKWCSVIFAQSHELMYMTQASNHEPEPSLSICSSIVRNAAASTTARTTRAAAATRSR